MNKKLTLATLILTLALLIQAQTITKEITASKDNTMFSEGAETLSNGSGDFLLVITLLLDK